MNDPLLLSTKQLAERLGYTAVSTIYKMEEEGRLPACLEHAIAYGQPRERRYSALKVELWCAGVDVEKLTDTELARLVIEAKVARQALAEQERAA